MGLGSWLKDKGSAAVDLIGDAGSEIGSGVKRGFQILTFSYSEPDPRGRPPSPYSNMDGIDTTFHIPIVYGTARVQGRIVFRGADPANGKVYYCVVFCMGTVDGLNTFYINGVDAAGASLSAYNTVYFKDGIDGQTVDSTLNTLFPTEWTTAHRLRGVCYAVVEMSVDDGPFSDASGPPNFQASINGREILDTRTSTTALSRNPAMVIRDYLLSDNGAQLNSGVLDTTTFEAAADYYDAVVNPPSGAQAFMEFDGVVDTSKSVGANVEDMCRNFNSYLVYWQGTFKLIVDQDGASQYAFTNNDIVGKLDIVRPSKSKRLNSISMDYQNEDNSWLQETIRVIDATYLSDDGLTLEEKGELRYVANKYQVDRFCTFMVDRSRYMTMLRFKSHLSPMNLTPGDVVTFTNSDKGWSAKEFKVLDITLNPDFSTMFTLIEHQDTIYTVPSQSTITDPNGGIGGDIEVSAPTNLSAEFGNDFNQIIDFGIVVRAYFDWDGPTAENVNRYQVQYKRSDATNWNDWGFVYNGQTHALVPVEAGYDYDFRVRSKHAWGFLSEWALLEDQTVPAATGVPNYFIPNVHGLQIDNGDTTVGNGTEWVGQDLKLTWRRASGTTYELGQEPNGGDDGYEESWFNGYRVRIFESDGTTLRREELVADTQYIYTYEKNVEDGIARSIVAKVYVESTFNQLSPHPAQITCSNPAPALPTGVTVTPGWRKITVNWTEPTDTDYQGMIFWIDTSSGTSFTVGDAYEVQRISVGQEECQIDFLPSGAKLSTSTDYYLRFAPFDAFGTDEINQSAEYSTTTNQSGNAKLDGVSAWALEIDPADEAFITAQIEADAIPSTRIANLAAGKITTGTLLATTIIKVDGTGNYELSLGNHVAQDGSPGTEAVISFGDPTTGTYPIILSADGDATFKGSLSTGSISGDLNILLGGSVYSGKASYSSTTAGFFIGFDESASPGVAAINIGDADEFVKWTGSNLEIAGKLTIKTASVVEQSINLNGANAAIYTNGKTSYSDTDAGYWLGNDSGVYKMNIGDSTKYLKWTGSAVEVAGDIISATGSGKRIHIDATNNEMYFYGPRDSSVSPLVIEKLCSIGVNAYGGDNVIGYFGTLNSKNIAVLGLADDERAIAGVSETNYGVYGLANDGSSTVAAVYGASNGSGPGVEGQSASGVGVLGNGSSGRDFGFTGNAGAPTGNPGRCALYYNTSNGGLYYYDDFNSSWEQIAKV